jgi:hypothetical protein
MPPPQAPATAAPAAAAVAPVASPDREAALQQFAQQNGPDAAAVFRDVLDYKRGLPHGALGEKWITAARAIDRTFDPTKFEKETKEGPANNPYAYGEKPTEAQAKDATYATRLFRAERVLRLPDVTEAAMDPRQRIAGSVPIVGNYLVTPSYQRYDQASRDFINATLRRESGAAINADEFANAYRQYLPRPNDSPAVLADKRANRAEAIKGITGGAGRSFTPSHLFDGELIPTRKRHRHRKMLFQRERSKVANDAEANTAIREATDALNDPRHKGTAQRS